LSTLRLNRLGRKTRGQVAGRPISASGEMERIDALGTQLASLGNRLELVDGQARKAIQRVGIVRYNPFEDTGSNQSFVLAVLDAHANGFVLSSLHSRQQTRVFLKPVAAGKTETALSEEEAEAIRRAIG
jgi:uncharacterized protein DUF4446